MSMEYPPPLGVGQEVNLVTSWRCNNDVFHIEKILSNHFESLTLNSTISPLSKARISAYKSHPSEGNGLIEKYLPLGILTVTVYIVVMIECFKMNGLATDKPHDAVVAVGNSTMYLTLQFKPVFDRIAS